MAPPRILYVDDDAGLRRLTQRALSRRGFDVEVAEDADTGLALIREGRFDLAAIDHTMPGKDGLTMLREIVTLEDHPPVVFVTGTDEPQVAVEALTSGATDFVIKTVGHEFFDLLAGRLRGALDRRRLEREKLQAEADLRAANEQLEMLVREVHHRVSNSLQMVLSFVAMQANQTENEAAREALEATQNRIRAISKVHHRLYTRDDLSTIDLDEYLATLVEELRDSLLSGEPVALALSADPVEVTPDAAVSIGVIVNELVNNALKYAFVDGREGTVTIALSAAGDGSYSVTVSDDGCGIAPGDGRPQGTGMGMRIINAVARSLDTEVEQVASGTGTIHRFTVTR